MEPSTIQETDTRPLRHWLNGADEPHLVICCAEHPDIGGWSRAILKPRCAHAVVQLASCAAEVNPAVLLELVAGGASGVTVVLEGCTNPAGAEAVVARASAFLSALSKPNRPQSIGTADTLPHKGKRGVAWPILSANAVPLSRRALLGGPVELDLARPSKHPIRRLIAVLRELTNGTDSWKALDGIPTGVPGLTASGCAGSGVCARACPVGALTVIRDVLAEATQSWDAIAQFQLTLDPGKCIDCGQCLQVCPESALKPAGEYLWSTLLAQETDTLRVGLTQRCARCGSPHGRLGILCGVCAFRSANPFGSTMPPGWQQSPDPASRDRLATH